MLTSTRFPLVLVCGILLPPCCSAQVQGANIRTGLVIPSQQYRVSVEEAGGAVWIVADDFNEEGGLYRWPVGSESNPEPYNLDAGRVFRVEKVGGIVWVLAEDDLYRVGTQGRPEPMRLDSGDVARVEWIGGVIWITMKGTGLYRLSPDDKLEKIPFDDDAGYVFQVVAMGSEVWFNTKGGLYRAAAMGNPQKILLDSEDVSRITKAGGALWVEAKGRLYRMEPGGQPKPTGLDDELFFPIETDEKERIVWFVANDRLYRWPAASANNPEKVELNTEAVYQVTKAGGVVWVLTESTHFRIDPAGNPVPTGLSGHSYVREAGGAVWFTGKGGVYRWPIGSSGQPVSVGVDVGDDFAVMEAGGAVWIKGKNRVFRSPVGSSTNPKPTGLHVERDFSVMEAGGAVWINTGRELLLLTKAEQAWNTSINPTMKFQGIPSRDSFLPIEWKIENYGRRTAPDVVLCRVLVRDSKEQDKTFNKVRVYEVPQGQFEMTLSPLPPGDYQVTVEATDLWGEIAISTPLEIRVYASAWEIVREWTGRLGVAFITVNTLLFLGLVLVSHWSVRSLEFLTSAWVLRFGIYYGWALRKVPLLQVWILAPYYRTARLKYEKPVHSYVPRLLSHPLGPGVLSTALLDELRRERRIWVAGGPGTGKTETVGEVVRAYFAKTGSAWSGWRQYGFIPVLVRLRDTSEASLVRTLEVELSRLGLSFGDDGFAQRFLRSAPFLFILDGVNEACLSPRQLEAWLPDFLQTSPRARVLATSQTLEGSGSIPCYQMPPLTGDIARDLLCALLGDVEGSKAYDAAPSDLWSGAELLTGYEVLQVADLGHRGLPIPSNRTELYNATLEGATDGIERSDVIRESLSSLAWNAWLQGLYRFSPNDDLAQQLPLKLFGPILVRRGVGVDGIDDYEFVHELMRAYLAARWAVNYSTSPIARLDNEEVWRPSPSRRNLSFYSFLAELISDRQAMQDVAEFALESPVLRAGLLDAAQQVARRRGWVLQLSTGPERVDYIQALCNIADSELSQVIVALSLDLSDFTGSKKERATKLFEICRKGQRLPELRKQVRHLYPDAPLFERYRTDS